MRVLIDGHNALGALRIRGKTHQLARRELLRRVAERTAHAIVFFDARHAPPDAPRTRRERGVNVRYCRDREADAAILDTVRDAAEPARLVVVTNDREVAGKSGQLGAQTLAIGEFFGAQEPDNDRTPPRRRHKRMRFKPKDFGLPDEVDLDDPDID